MEKNENFLLINKPEGWTSFDVVALVRKHAADASPPFQGGARGGLPSDASAPQSTATPSSLPLGKGEMTKPTKPKRLKVGHAGTLDPFATGLLIVGVGRESTKQLDKFKAMPKTYVATIKLGAVSDTYDKTGHISLFPRGSAEGDAGIAAPTPSPPASPCEAWRAGRAEGEDIDETPKHPTISEINEAIKSFLGKQKQIPPMFSAKKINGKRLYELARQGIEIERQPNAIEIYKIKILNYSWPFLKIEVQCSAGTYIRSLANDIGKKLGTGAYCYQLVRAKIGKYSLKKAIDINSLSNYMPQPKKEAALDPWIIEEIKKEEERKRKEQEQEQPRIDIPGDMPDHDPEERRRWEEEEERKRRGAPGGVKKIDML